ncbi:AMP-binding protein [Phenylobacterium sp. J367]|uniref:AMP-binding protein n=1 Tax=Phenylobacterium sp. J367 TaxID=2898435 RepID=UPI002150EBC5|nr:AMP-binding protein [Phenylobacterium sp. J367]
MLYTSGTTGRPKGVYKRSPEPVLPQGPGTYAAYDPGVDVALCCGPAYHAAPLLMDVRWPLASGVPIVMMEKFDPEEALRLIERHRVTHTHMVPTMFQRLLQLPADIRDRYDVSSLKMVIHGAAPCPVATKRAMIAWLGPVLTEYYAATEGGGGFVITSQEWLNKPGSVGRLDPNQGARVLNEDGHPCPPGQVGKVYLRADPGSRFSYYKDAAKTDALFEGDHFTLGDMGYLDGDGYLFLTGRTAELIISGGVNIYPQEIDNVVSLHPAVADVCTIGAPNEEWGEEVRSVVELRAGYSPSPGARRGHPHVRA